MPLLALPIAGLSYAVTASSPPDAELLVTLASLIILPVAAWFDLWDVPRRAMAEHADKIGATTSWPWLAKMAERTTWTFLLWFGWMFGHSAFRNRPEADEFWRTFWLWIEVAALLFLAVLIVRKLTSREDKLYAHLDQRH